MFRWRVQTSLSPADRRHVLPRTTFTLEISAARTSLSLVCRYSRTTHWWGLVLVRLVCHQLYPLGATSF